MVFWSTLILDPNLCPNKLIITHTTHIYYQVFTVHSFILLMMTTLQQEHDHIINSIDVESLCFIHAVSSPLYNYSRL